jgi:hypothetical protein
LGFSGQPLGGLGFYGTHPSGNKGWKQT